MKAKDLTLGGILIALTLVILYSSSILPISTLTILTLASCLIPICIIRSSVKTGFLVYIGSTTLGFFIIPINIIVYYGLFFGVYGIIKYYIERLRKLYLEIILKLIIFNIIFIISFTVATLFLGNVVINIPLWLLWLLAQPTFIVFDYALTLIIGYYLNRFHKVM
ncbi:hypothetical protein [Clostridium gasigenes]|uniref:hypothetical protein n=1 Tax=Clostridium gasigenes TaxID=94869 RepID=UPI0014385695|nr:hypothetical protein [Clostridium gasigenes]MBU3103123.1 hypothetical protein [Clostridium gasigenes]MBU3106770.1 hypothetical protein [Clostridium gasigenes]MBU3131716.1 hypothetical protein [Clostridium gasigenes]MBU3135188.1 hypothetical protein [Clostridium gasigenes]NKF05477.1 hypothetical protein [Clostridium gasigenes]